MAQTKPLVWVRDVLVHKPKPGEIFPIVGGGTVIVDKVSRSHFRGRYNVPDGLEVLGFWRFYQGRG